MSEPTVTPPGFFKKLRLGNEYLKTWPVEKQLAPVFLKTVLSRQHDLAFAICHPSPFLP